MPRNKKSGRPRLSRVSVQPEPRDEVDWDKFAFAVLQHARLEAERRRGGQDAAEGRS